MGTERSCRRARLRGPVAWLPGGGGKGADLWTHFGGQETGQLACQSAMGSQINSATSMTRSGPAWPGSLGVRTSPVQTQTASFSRR
jgi:hypothetical protein